MSPAAVDAKVLKDLMFGTGGARRFTQDSPIMPDVWLAFGERPAERVDLLFTPDNHHTAGELSRALRKQLGEERKSKCWRSYHRKSGEPAEIAYNQSTVVAKLYFDELIRAVLPLTGWWQDHVLVDGGKTLQAFIGDEGERLQVAAALSDPERQAKELGWPPDLLWMFRVVGTIALAQREALRLRELPRRDGAPDAQPLVEVIARMVDGIPPVAKPEWKAVLWSVNRNRPAEMTVVRSTLAVKADAARRLFEVTCKDLSWAVLDGGIDATHPAFRRREQGGPSAKPLPDAFVQEGDRWKNQTRVLATYDFTRIRGLLNPSLLAREKLPETLRQRLDQGGPDADRLNKDLQQLKLHLLSGREIDWSLLDSLLRVPHDGGYEPPRSDHGTHVAGILAADWRAGEPGREGEESLQGICPDLQLYDLRVLDDGGGDEFTVIAALQFVRHLNAHKDEIVVHGTNLSLSIRHDVTNYACGCTPVCEECERLVGAGVVVVAAAGNQGWHKETPDGVVAEGYNSISITDPGNAEGVITVGATHRFMPHTYGVSYFSSRGPTGDGRIKPDLVAPGEKITSALPDGKSGRKDGTSMAAPHVSGAAALLIARYRELAGRPARIKSILCSTATDLGRERYFQGCGMLDILRALQSV